MLNILLVLVVKNLHIVMTSFSWKHVKSAQAACGEMGWIIHFLEIYPFPSFYSFNFCFSYNASDQRLLNILMGKKQL